MGRYINSAILQKFGKNIRKMREAKEISIADVAAMTGFKEDVIRAVENGGDTDLSHLTEIAFAIGHHPMELINVPLTIKPRFPLPAPRVEKNYITRSIRNLIKAKFFKEERETSAVTAELEDKFSIKEPAKKISAILGELVRKEELTATKVGNKNLYKKRE